MSSALARLASGRPHDVAIEPGCKADMGLFAAKGSKSTKERLLEGLLGRRYVADERNRCTERPRLVTQKELGEAILLAGQAAGNQVLVRIAHVC